MKVLFPAWTSARADEAKLTALHDLAVQLLVQGIHPDMSAAQMQLLTAKVPPRDLSALKKSLLRPGFVEEWNKLDSLASGFAKTLLSKQNAKPSATFKLFTSYDPEAVLWLGFTSKDKAVQERYNNFLKVWPEARQRIPHLLMQEMRITPELPIYADVSQKIFLELIDGKLTTPEEMRAFLEPYSPPAPPPQVTIKRSRAKRAGARIKEAALEDEESEDALPEEDLDSMGGDDDELDLAHSAQGRFCGRNRRRSGRRRRRRSGWRRRTAVKQEARRQKGTKACACRQALHPQESLAPLRKLDLRPNRPRRSFRRKLHRQNPRPQRPSQLQPPRLHRQRSPRLLRRPPRQPSQPLNPQPRPKRQPPSLQKPPQKRRPRKPLRPNLLRPRPSRSRLPNPPKKLPRSPQSRPEKSLLPRNRRSAKARFICARFSSKAYSSSCANIRFVTRRRLRIMTMLPDFYYWVICIRWSGATRQAWP